MSAIGITVNSIWGNRPGPFDGLRRAAEEIEILKITILLRTLWDIRNRKVQFVDKAVERLQEGIDFLAWVKDATDLKSISAREKSYVICISALVDKGEQLGLQVAQMTEQDAIKFFQQKLVKLEVVNCLVVTQYWNEINNEDVEELEKFFGIIHDYWEQSMNMPEKRYF